MTGYVYYKQYSHIVRGFLLNGVRPRRLGGSARLHFRRSKSTSLYTLITRNIYDHSSWADLWFTGDDTTIANGVLQAVNAAGLVQDAVSGWSPTRFLEEYKVRNIDDARPIHAFDLACAAGLCGDLDFARRGLARAREARLHLAQLCGPYGDHEAFLQVVADGLAVLDQGADAFRAYMRQQTTAAAMAHGFCPPTFDSPDPP